MRRICIIPCGRKKIWEKEPEIGAVLAKDAYIGIFHGLCQLYANEFFQEWVILSAKHGFLLPDDIVPENYDVSFSMKNHPNIITIGQLKKQALQKNLYDVDQVVVLGGKKFRPIVEQVFPKHVVFSYPLSNCRGIGEMQKLLKLSVESHQEMNG